MKRSEMKNRIKSVIESFLHSSDPKFDLLSSFIVDEIERAGMKPPYFQGQLSNYDVAMGSNPYRWEKEDE